MSTREIPTGQLVDLATESVGLAKDSGSAVLMVWDQPGPPPRLDGHTVGAPYLTVGGEPPHAGEVHPDGDELLYLVSGAMSVRLELPDGDRVVDVRAGQALVVPQGVWHRIKIRESGQLIHVTPGPRGDYRPRPTSGVD